MTDEELRYAILIDADNISDKYISIILDEVSNNGVATYKRIYGDWTSTRLTSWKSVLLQNSIIPMQQYSYTSGKNATDSAMIIDAMDILYSGTVDGFCIVSSDSDFTRLAARLRESGMQVIGMGEEKTPEPFISACNQFKYLDLLYTQRMEEERAEAAAAAAEEAAARAARTARRPGQGMMEALALAAAQEADSSADDAQDESTQSRKRRLKRVRQVINSIIDQFSDDDGWISSDKLGDRLAKRLPDFDVRNFGYRKLTSFVKSLGVYEFKSEAAENGRRKNYFRLREQ